MALIYGILLSGYLVLWIISRKKQKTTVSIHSKEHPLRMFYPMAALLLRWRKKLFPRREDPHLQELLRSIYVKENVEKEKALYQIRKVSAVLAIVAAMLASGFLITLADAGTTYVRSLERADYGQGTTSYELSVDYRNREETVELSVESLHYTESEIRDLFDQSYEAVKEQLLADNESQDHVTGPLNLISSYHGISITWEIEDISAVNYNGDIKVSLKEGEALPVNLFATFSMDGIVQTCTIPVCLTGESQTEARKLWEEIQQNIEESNDIYSKEVVLPQELDGYRIFFKQTRKNRGILFLFLAAAAVITILLFYDRTLEQQDRKRKAQMMLDFTEIVSKLNLLYDAGLSIHGAFERIVEDYEKKVAKEQKVWKSRNDRNAQNERGEWKEQRYAYVEMKLALEKIRSGVSETQAYSQFGKRCGLPCYLKLGNLLEQNLNKGAKGMKALLQKEVTDAYEERKRLARKKGEEASTKMLGPMVMMLMIVIIIVALPALMSMNF